MQLYFFFFFRESIDQSCKNRLDEHWVAVQFQENLILKEQLFEETQNVLPVFMLEPVEVKHQNHAEEYIVVLEYRRVLFGYFLDFLGCVFDRKCVTHQCDVLQELVLLLSMLDSLLVCHQLIPIFILIRPVCLLVFLLHVADVEELSHIVRHRYPA